MLLQSISQGPSRVLYSRKARFHQRTNETATIVRQGAKTKPCIKGRLSSSFSHLPVRLKQQLLRSKDRNGNCSCRDSDVVFPVVDFLLCSVASRPRFGGYSQVRIPQLE
jgi:hypothetical protein